MEGQWLSRFRIVTDNISSLSRSRPMGIEQEIIFVQTQMAKWLTVASISYVLLLKFTLFSFVDFLFSFSDYVCSNAALCCVQMILLS